jgi:hypothetical protein
MIRGTFLLVILLPFIVACRSGDTRHEGVERTPMRELFPPLKKGDPIPDPSAAPAIEPQVPAPAAAKPPEATRWPVTIASANVTFQVYEPVLDAMRDDQLTFHSLVLARAVGQKPVPGSVLMTAKTEGDAADGAVALRELQVTDVAFQSQALKAWDTVLRRALPENIHSVQRSRLESAKSVLEARERAAATAVVAVPRIIISQKPAVLVYIDGEPRYAPLRSGSLTHVVNTRALLLKSSSGTLYLHLYDGWVSAASLQGPWVIASAPPGAAKLEQAARDTKRVDLLLGKPDPKGRGASLKKGALPEIIVSTTPTALVVIDGAPTFTPIAGTSFQYATNTSAHLFRDLDTKSLYVRAGGHWFRAGAVAGPWEYVPAQKLSAAFSTIPDDSPKRGVKRALAADIESQTGTPATAPAVVAAEVKTARLSVTMDGDPVLQPIAGTQLNFVANASLPIIQVDINNWYVVQNGVWFHGSTATGPWTVTDAIPAEISAIPPTSPIYSAIHSHVLWSSSDVIYYGYPGAGSLAAEGGAIGVEDQGSDYQYTPPSGLYWSWVY